MVGGVGEPVEEEEPPEPILAGPPGEADEGDGGEDGERDLHDGLVRAAVVVVAGGVALQAEEGCQGDGECQEEEDRPGKPRLPQGGLVHAHPPEAVLEGLQLDGADAAAAGGRFCPGKQGRGLGIIFHGLGDSGIAAIGEGEVIIGGKGREEDCELSFLRPVELAALFQLLSELSPLQILFLSTT